MNLQPVLEQRAKVEEFTRKHRVGLLTLLFTDLVGSTKLKQEFGDRESVALIQRHHASVREILSRFSEGEEIGTAGDSFFIVFTKPSDAVQFSLLLQAGLRELARERSRPLLDRVGIHIGEVVIEERPGAPKPRDMYGLQVDICARVMSLAEGDQVLLTRSAFDNARQVLKGQDIEGVGTLSWLNHGPYLLKGVEEPMEICEVGETGASVLKAPGDSEKVHRYVSAESEPVLGWRPAIGQGVPGTSWVLEEKLGEGGFGEVWLGRHKTTKERRVFKFCFRADRVRSLKREVTLFRVMKERLGEHPHIAGVQDVYLEEPPFYLTMEYVSGRDLKTWCEANGGIGAIPLETRLEIVAQVADALQAAHDAGVIHRDVKPSNILVAADVSRRLALSSEAASEESAALSPAQLQVQAKLTDFGIGQVVSEEALAGLTRMGFTQTMLGSSSQGGTQMYVAPELIAGKPASTRSDIYSLGVVLYQMIVGDFSRPLTTDWARAISDSLLRDDLYDCFAGNPQVRFRSAAELARRLHAMPQRRIDLENQRTRQLALERAAYRRGVARTAGVAALIIAAFAALALFAFKEKTDARRLLYIADMNLVQQAWEHDNIGQVRQLLQESAGYEQRGFEWYHWMRQIHLELKTLRHDWDIYSVAFSPDGKRIVTAYGDTMAKVWDAASGKELPALNGHNGSIRRAVFSPDGQRIITANYDHTATVWDAGSWKELLTLKGHRERISQVAISGDGQRIVTASQDSTAKVWDAISGKDLVTLKLASGLLPSLAISSDGQRIVTHGEDYTAKVWDAASGKGLLVLERHSAQIDCVAFSPNGQRIVTGSHDLTAKVWDAVSGKELLTLKGHRDPINAVAFSHDGLRIVTGSEDQTGKVWDAASGKELLTLKGHTAPITAVAFSLDGQRIATGSKDRTAKIWDTAANQGLITFRGFGVGYSLCSVAFVPNIKRIVTGSTDSRARVWDATEGKELLTLKGHGGPVLSVAVARDGQRIATASVDHTAKAWDATSGKELVTFKGHSAQVNSVAFSADSRRIATASGDQTAKVWDAASGNELLTFKGHGAPYAVSSVAFSPDGRWIVSGSQTAKVWDATTGKERFTLSGHKGIYADIVCVAFSSDGQRILTGSMDETAKVWDAATGREMLTLKGHKGGIASVAFFPDGQRILTGGADHTARLWEVGSGKELLILKGHSGVGVALAQDGQRIVIAGGDGTAKVWEAATKEHAAAWQKEEKLR